MEMKCPECGATTTSRYVCGACGKAIFIQKNTGASAPVPAAPVPMAPAPPPAMADEQVYDAVPVSPEEQTLPPPASEPPLPPPVSQLLPPVSQMPPPVSQLPALRPAPMLTPAPEEDRTQRVQVEQTPRADNRFDFQNASGGAPDQIALPHPEAEREVTDPEMNLPAPGKYVFTRPKDADLPLELDHSTSLPEMHDLPERDLMVSEHASETAALDASRRIQNRRRSWMGRLVILILMGVMGGVYYIGMKLYTLHVPRSWMADQKISSQLSLAIAATPSKDTVEIICSSIAGHGSQVAEELRKVEAKDRVKFLDEALGHWEALDDGRAFIGARPMPADAVDLMKKCSEGSKKVGRAIAAFQDEKPPADTAALALAAAELHSIVSGRDAAKIAKAPFENRMAHRDEHSLRYGFDSPPYSLAEARERTETLHEIGPDRRFVLALKDVQWLLTKSVQEPNVSGGLGGDGKLHFHTDGNKEAAVLSATPDFDEMAAALANHARALLKDATPTKATSIPSSNGPVLIDQAMFSEWLAVDNAWVSRDLALATRAAHAGVSLAVQQNDSTSTGDLVNARAWALVAVARAYGGGWDADEALLAHTLGYRRAALALTSRLGPQDAVRAFISEDDTALKRAAEARRATPGVRYLWARRVAESGSPSAMEQLPEFSLDDDEAAQSFVALLARRGRKEGTDEEAVHALRLEIRDLRRFAALDAKGRARVSTPSERELQNKALDLYDNALSRIPAPPMPAPFDLPVQRAASHGRFYESIGTMVETRVIRAHRSESGEEFLRWLGHAPDQLSGVRYWVDSLVNPDKDNPRGRGVTQAMALAGAPKSATLAMAGVSPMAELGGISEASTAMMVDRNFSAEDAAKPGAIAAVMQLSGSLDGRPDNLAMLLQHEPLVVDPIMRAGLTRRLALLRGTDEERSRAAAFSNDSDELQRLEEDPRVPLAIRLDASRRLMEADKLTEEEALTRVHAMAEADKRAAAQVAVADWLTDRESPDEATTLLREWLAAHPKDEGDGVRQIRRALARSLRLQDKAKEAWEAIESAMGEGSEEVRYEGALSLIALGQKDELKKWGEKLSDQESEAGDLYAAGLAWRSGSPVEAAKLIDGHEQDAFWAEKVPTVLAEALHGKSPEETKAAVEALSKKLPNASLRALANGLMREKERTLAAAIIELVPAKSLEEVADSFTILEAGQGTVPARKWLAAQPAPSKPYELVVTAFRRNADGLVLAAPDNAGDAVHSELIWLLKAASAVRTKVTSGDDYANIRKHFETLQADNLRRMEGRFLLGLGREDTLFRTDEPSFDELASAAFCRGVAAEGAGKIEEAALHYLDSVKFNAARDAEGGWALQRLRTWRDADKSLARIAAEGL